MSDTSDRQARRGGRIKVRRRGRSQSRKGKRRNRLQTLQVFQCRVELKKSAVVVGDIYTPRIVIEDGASLKGSVQVQKDIPRPQTKKEDAAATVK